jgi:hypothetical protein
VLPAWLAVIEQVPAMSGVSVEPLTMQTLVVVEAKLTVSPELAVAVKANGEAGSVSAAGCAKVMA